MNTFIFLGSGLGAYHAHCTWVQNKHREVKVYDYVTGQQSFMCIEPLMTDRVMYAVLNGIVSVYPMLPFTLYNDIKRVEIWLSKKNPEHYPDAYKENF
jgi:hypothetical protein